MRADKVGSRMTLKDEIAKIQHEGESKVAAQKQSESDAAAQVASFFSEVVKAAFDEFAEEIRRTERTVEYVVHDQSARLYVSRESDLELDFRLSNENHSGIDIVTEYESGREGRRSLPSQIRNAKARDYVKEDVTQALLCAYRDQISRPRR